MKKLFFVATAFLCGAISANAVDYLVQTGKEGDAVWTDAAITALNVATDKVIDLSKGGTLPTTGEIWFAAGTYDFTAQYGITQGAKLYGGFAGTETKTPTRALKASNKPYDFTNPTIFNVKQPETDDKVKILPEQVNGLVLDGICIQNSVGTGTAGVCRLASGSKVFNCTFKNCSSNNQGGVFMIYNATATIGGCLFEGNYAKQGGVIHIGSGTNPNYTVTIDTCDFLNNYIISGGNAGGAINKQNDGETLLISNCNFIGNDAPSNGATLSINGVSTTTIANSLITGSKTKTAIYVPGSLNLYYCTVVENAAGAIYVANVNTTNAVVNIKNNVFWATTAAAANCGLASAKGTATNNASLQNWTGSENLSVADNIKLELTNTGNEGKLYPVFADPENGDFNIGEGSALIGKGVAIEGITTDITGKTRETLDLGAYEHISGEDIGSAVENTEKAPLDIQAALQAGEVYNLLGQRVGELQIGNIYIVGGQKILMR